MTNRAICTPFGGFFPEGLRLKLSSAHGYHDSSVALHNPSPLHAAISTSRVLLNDNDEREVIDGCMDCASGHVQHTGLGSIGRSVWDHFRLLCKQDERARILFISYACTYMQE